MRKVSISREIHLPADIKPGQYVTYAIVKYDGIVGTGTGLLEVVEKPIATEIILYTVVLVSSVTSVYVASIYAVPKLKSMIQLIRIRMKIAKIVKKKTKK